MAAVSIDYNSEKKEIYLAGDLGGAKFVGGFLEIAIRKTGTHANSVGGNTPVPSVEAL